MAYRVCQRDRPTSWTTSSPWSVRASSSSLLSLTISQIECDPDDGPSILQRMTLTYALGEQHGLYEPLKAAQRELGFY